jgi:hypothetical protein
MSLSWRDKVRMSLMIDNLLFKFCANFFINPIELQKYNETMNDTNCKRTKELIEQILINKIINKLETRKYNTIIMYIMDKYDESIINDNLE